ncbi:deaminase [Actinomadura cremea]|nr:deaminase [Actinomadura cremea]
MATVNVEMSMSLDGFIADRDGKVGPLFDWYGNGPVKVPARAGNSVFELSEASARHLADDFAAVGAAVAGRRTFDITDGFADGHPYGVPVFVVTHAEPAGWRGDPSITIVTDGVESAVRRACEAAGDKVVTVTAADVARQCLELGLIDVVRINLVPVLLGDGIRLFDELAGVPIELEDPEVVQGTRVTHLYYRVKRS